MAKHVTGTSYWSCSRSSGCTGFPSGRCADRRPRVLLRRSTSTRATGDQLVVLEMAIGAWELRSRSPSRTFRDRSMTGQGYVHQAVGVLVTVYFRRGMECITAVLEYSLKDWQEVLEKRSAALDLKM
eukprot:3311434-Heterocapsa_arctica.AAC.1